MRGMFLKLSESLKNGRSVIASFYMKNGRYNQSRIGTHMLFDGSGCIFGNFDNGYVIKNIRNDVMRLSDGHHDGIKTYGYTLNGNPDVIKSDFCMAFLNSSDPSDILVAERALQLMNEGEKMWLVVNTETSSLSVVDAFGVTCGKPVPLEISSIMPRRAEVHECKGVKYYIEPAERHSKVYIFGASEIARSLVSILRHTGFRVVVFDNSGEYANRARFSDVYDVRTVDYANMEHLILTEDDLAVVVTRDFMFDENVELFLLSTPVKAIINVGYTGKTLYEKKWFSEYGYNDDQLKRLYTIETNNQTARTTYEIAVCIAAQLIMNRPAGC